MKTMILLFAMILLTGMGYGQKTISNPKVVLDTTYNGTRFIYSWTSGVITAQPVDSSLNDTVHNRNYFDLTGSNVELKIQKKRIIASGDTIIKYEFIQIPFIDIQKAMDDLYTSSSLKKSIKKALKTSFKLKVSEEINR